MFRNFILKIRRAETPGYARLKNILKSILRFSVPSIKVIHYPLYRLHVFLDALWVKMKDVVWLVPIFRARCLSCGPGLLLGGRLPFVQGSNLEIVIGENVQMYGVTFAAGQLYDTPKLHIGDRAILATQVSISVAVSVEIGEDTLIASHVFIADNPGHSISPNRRQHHLPILPEDAAPISIGKNCWIGTRSMIFKGVTIGDNSIVAANSVVTSDIPPNTLYAGSPARFIRDISDDAETVENESSRL